MTAPSSSGGSLLTPVMTVVSVAALGVACWSFREVRHLTAEMARRPPVAVIPRGALMREAAGSTTPHAVYAQDESIKAASRQLRAQGYVVLDGEQMLAWPRALEVRPHAQAAPADDTDGSP